MSKLAPPPVTFGELSRGQRFIVAPRPGVVYTAATPAFVFMRLTPQGDVWSGFNSVNLTTGIVAMFLDGEVIIPVSAA